MASSWANKDVVTEILLNLPVKSLLRCRSVCKFWRDVIDSPTFRKSHVQQQATNNNKDDTVFVQFSFLQSGVWELSIKFLDNWKSYNDFPAFKEFFKDYMSEPYSYHSFFLRVAGPVKGLICFHCPRLDEPYLINLPIAVCNPSLGQIKTLPTSPVCYFSCFSTINSREVGIGFDNVAQDYKVVQLMSCREHRRLHAHVYSKRTNSWRELAGDSNIPDEELYIHKIKPIKSTCKTGSFAHWQVFDKILSFDMKNEVFRTFNCAISAKVKIFATEDSFVLFDYDIGGGVSPRKFEAKFEVSELEWIPVKSFGPFGRLPRPMTLWKSDCVVLKHSKRCNIYDYCDRGYVGTYEKPKTASMFKMVEYKGSLISP
ncbi:hypothetical protein C2S52_015182 [Perilla frutescens var. hirtella]|nr:hypothetical protein C2S52_015182 [Perilla frutescens var. hirtella]